METQPDRARPQESGRQAGPWDAMRTTEFRRRDFGHMELQITIDDPKAYTEPFTATIQFHLLPDTDLIEDVCDNEKDARHEFGR